MYTFRPATNDDISFLYGLLKATLKDYVLQTWGRWDEEWQVARFRVNFDPTDIQVIVVDGKDAGDICLVQRASDLFLLRIEISPEYQGRGIGTAIINDIIARANSLGLPVALQVLKVNPARRLYERLGFVVVGETDTHFLMRRDVDEVPG